MKKAAVKHPIVFSVIVVLLFLAAQGISFAFLMFIDPFFRYNGDFLIQFCAECVLALCGILLMALFGYGSVWNNTKNYGRGLLCGGYMIVIGLLSAAGTAIQAVFTILPIPPEYDYLVPQQELQPIWQIGVFILTMFLIGITEESFFRGIVANLFWDKHAKDPAGVWTATIYSGLVFGLMHFVNLGADPEANAGVFVQMIAAIALGMMLTAIYYRSRNLWVTVSLHAFWDFCALLPEGLFGGSVSEVVGSYSALSAITSSVPSLIVTCVLLRKKKVQELLSASSGVPENAIGYIPNQWNVNSTLSSIHSRDKAIIAAIIAVSGLFFGANVLRPDFETPFSTQSGLFDTSVLDITNSGEWEGDQTFGSRYNFEIDESGDYRIKIESRPEDTNASVLVQITDGDGDVAFQENYGGICTIEFSLYLDAGEYELNLVYNYTEATKPGSDYSTRVTIG